MPALGDDEEPIPRRRHGDPEVDLPPAIRGARFDLGDLVEDLFAVGRGAQEDPFDRSIGSGPEPEPDVIRDPQSVEVDAGCRADVPGRPIVVQRCKPPIRDRPPVLVQRPISVDRRATRHPPVNGTPG